MRHSSRRLCVGVAALGVVASLAPSALGAAGGSVPVRVGPTGRVVEAGATAVIKVGTTCPVGWEALEAFATLSQDGQGSLFGFIPVTCDGTRRVYTVRVPASEGQMFKPGTASASVYVLLLEQQSGETRAGDALRDVELIGRSVP